MTVKEAEPKYAAQNRKARHDYFIEETLECGLVLTGTEVKALRKGGASIQEAFAGPKDGDLYLLNAHIPNMKRRRASTTRRGGRASCWCGGASGSG